MPPDIQRLFDLHADSGTELITTVLQGAGFRLEHIASNGAASPPGYWYDQDLPEWVALVRGSATLEFEDGSLQLSAGSSLVISAHLRHRVTRTSADAEWLAIHFRAEA